MQHDTNVWMGVIRDGKTLYEPVLNLPVTQAMAEVILNMIQSEYPDKFFLVSRKQPVVLPIV